jgi:GntR family colanic acid and biofilm gene transcriptional regulator
MAGISTTIGSIGSIARGETLTDQAEAVLREALMSGVFVPGRIITIRALSAMLNVSVTPSKEAMVRLIADRVLEWGPRRSALVPVLTLKSVNEIYTIRIALEAAAACAALDHFSRPEIAELRKVHDEVAKAFEQHDYKNVLARNRDFHFAIYRKAALPLMFGMIEGLWLRLGPSLNLLYSSWSKKDWAHREGTGYHPEIITAIQERDAEAMRRHIVSDLTTGRDRLEHALLAAGRTPLSLAVPE